MTRSQSRHAMRLLRSPVLGGRRILRVFVCRPSSGAVVGRDGCAALSRLPAPMHASRVHALAASVGARLSSRDGQPRKSDSRADRPQKRAVEAARPTRVLASECSRAAAVEHRRATVGRRSGRSGDAGPTNLGEALQVRSTRVVAPTSKARRCAVAEQFSRAAPRRRSSDATAVAARRVVAAACHTGEFCQ